MISYHKPLPADDTCRSIGSMSAQHKNRLQSVKGIHIFGSTARVSWCMLPTYLLTPIGFCNDAMFMAQRQATQFLTKYFENVTPSVNRFHVATVSSCRVPPPCPME
jgi:hypothetical protein